MYVKSRKISYYKYEQNFFHFAINICLFLCYDGCGLCAKTVFVVLVYCDLYLICLTGVVMRLRLCVLIATAAVSCTFSYYSFVSKKKDDTLSVKSYDMSSAADKVEDIAPKQMPVVVLEPVSKVYFDRHEWRRLSDKSLSIDVKKQCDLHSILKTAHIDDAQLLQIVNIVKKHAKGYFKLSPGFQVLVHSKDLVSSSEMLRPIKISVIGSKKLEIVYKNNKYEYKVLDMPAMWKPQVIAGVIGKSLHASLKAHGAGPRAIREVSNVLLSDSEIKKSIKKGEPFKVMYEVKTDHMGKVANDVKVVYASVGKLGKNKEVYRYAYGGDSIEYYDKKGNSVKRQMLKMPINGGKLTSGFGYRKHPVLHCNKMHEGVDYTAPHGTPVFAAGDGVIAYAKSHSGYGKHIEVQHNKSYSTLYAHLSKFAKDVRPGLKVAQGQLIGYVGATGLATGPHLHYEVIHNGRKVNPIKTNPMRFQTLSKKDLAKFNENIKRVDQMVAELSVSNGKNVAMN